MMQTAECWHGHDPATSIGALCRLRLRAFPSPTQDAFGRRDSTDVIIHESLQMARVENDHMIENIPAAVATQRSATPFCHGLRKLVRFGWMPKLFTVSITSLLNCGPRSRSDIWERSRKERLAQLLNHPCGGRMLVTLK